MVHVTRRDLGDDPAPGAASLKRLAIQDLQGLVVSRQPLTRGPNLPSSRQSWEPGGIMG